VETGGEAMINAIKKKIEQKIANEQQIIDRYEKEVTVDWPAVHAEVRHKAFSEVIEIIKKQEPTSDKP
jgi:hypothetical protein